MRSSAIIPFAIVSVSLFERLTGRSQESSLSDRGIDFLSISSVLFYTANLTEECCLKNEKSDRNCICTVKINHVYIFQ